MFKNMTVKTELIIAFGLLTALLAGVGSLGIYGLNQTNDGFKGVYEDRAVPLGDLGFVLDRMQRMRLNTVMAAYGRDADIVKERKAMTEQRKAEMDKTWQKYLATNLTPEEKTLIENFNQQWKTFLETSERTMGLAATGEYDAAIANLTTNVTPKFDAVHVTLFSLLDLQRTEAEKEYAAAQSSFQSIFVTTVSMIVLGILLASVLGFWLLRGIVGPLHRAIEIANAVAKGDLDVCCQKWSPSV